LDEGKTEMKGYPLHLYPVSLALLDTDPVTARATVKVPPQLPWQQLWMSVGTTFYALSGAYYAAKNLLDDSGAPYAAEFVSAGDDLHVVRMSYNSPLYVEMTIGSTAAFSLVRAVASEAICTIAKLLEWIESVTDLSGSSRLSNLALADPQSALVDRLFLLGSILRGEETEVWTTSSFDEGGDSDHESRQWNDETEPGYGSFVRDEEGRIWFRPAGPSHIIGGGQK
jgi:hypothetical protein